MSEEINAETINRLLDLPLPRNDSGASTVRGYLVALLAELWREEEGFSGKRPFGNSGWQHDIYGPMAKAGFVGGDEDGIFYRERGKADELIYAAIDSMGSAPAGGAS